MKTPPLRVVLYTSSDNRSGLADLMITTGFDEKADLSADVVHKIIRTVTAERRYNDLEALALELAHRLLDTQERVTSVEVEVAANSWRRLGAQAFERGSSEVRVAKAAVGRDGSASVSAAIRGLKLLMGPPVIETIDLEWTYKAAGAAGVSYNSAWSAVRKLALQAFDDREEPQAVAQLLVDVIEALAEVRLTIETETLDDSGFPGLLEVKGSPKQRSASAQAR